MEQAKAQPTRPERIYHCNHCFLVPLIPQPDGTFKCQWCDRIYTLYSKRKEEVK